MKKTITLILVFLMLAGLMFGAVGCKNDGSGENGPVSTPTDAETSENENLLADLPQKNFSTDGAPAEFNILNVEVSWGHYQMTSDDITTVINSAVFSRNSFVEEQLGVVIEETVLGADAIVSQMQNLHLSGTYQYDICYNIVRYQNNLLQYGTYLPVSDYDNYIDLSKPWWYEDELEALTINNNCYILAGDLNLIRNEAMWTIVFNRDILTNFGLESPYDLIERNEWTFEKMYQLGLDSWVEDSGKYAITSHFNVCTAFIVAADLHLVVKDDVNGLVRAEIDDHFVKVMEDTIHYFFEDNGMGKRNGIKTSYESNNFKNGNFGPQTTSFYHVRPFTEGNTTFMASPLGEMTVMVLGSGINYGFAPMPKYTSDQQYFNTCVYSAFSALSIPVEVDAEDGRLERVGTVLEWLNAYSYDIVRPAYYEHILYGRLLQEPQAVTALDIILASDPRGKAVLELDQVFKFGMADKLALSMSDCKPSFNIAVRTIREIVDDNIATTVKYYK